MKKLKDVEKILDGVLLPELEKPYLVPKNWLWVRVGNGFAECLDSFRKPVSANERAKRQGDIPYYGATGQAGWIDDYLTDEELVLVGEDGAPFLDPFKKKAYMIRGKAWVNNHAHILRSYFGESGNLYLLNYLNHFNYKGFVSGTTRLKLNQKSLNSIPIPLPPVAEQIRISDKIVNLFSKLDEAKHIIEEAKETFEIRRASILEKAFRGELTTKWREDNGVKFIRKEYAIHELITELNQGWSPKCENYPSLNYEKWGVIKTTAIQHMEFIEEENKQLPDLLEPREQHELKPWDILITRAGPRFRVGVCCLIKQVRPRLLLCDKAYRFRANLELVLPEFLVLALNTPEILEKINAMKTGISDSGVNLTQSKFSAIKLEIPPINEQKEIIRLVNYLIENEEKAIEHLNLANKIDGIKQSILSKAFCGELGTNDPNEESALELLKEILSEKSGR